MSNSSVPTHIDEALRWLVHDYIDDAILGVSFEVHRALKTGLLEAELGDRSDENQYLQVNVEGLDVFGQAPIKKSHECVCPNCSRSLAASRFAPHLEKCMGMGRNSSRIASRRIQNTSREGQSGGLSGTAGLGAPSDDDADDDWLVDRKKRKRDKNSPRRSRKLTAKAAAEGVSWNVISSGSDSEKRAVLSSICGVVSEHTRKMCTRSMKCPQHTSYQRRAVREQLLGPSEGSAVAEEDSVSSSTAAVPDDVQAEAEGTEEVSATAATTVVSAVHSSSGVASASSSWDHELHHSSTTSPADSTSTVLSSHSTNSSNRSASLPPNGDSHSSNGSAAAHNGSVISSSTTVNDNAAADGGFHHHFPSSSSSGNKSSSNSKSHNNSGSRNNSNSRSSHGEKKSNSSSSSSSCSKKKSSKSSSHVRTSDK